VSGYTFTFGEGLLEAASQALTDGGPVLYVAFDIEARGPVGTMQPSRGVLAGALVLSPEASERSLAKVVFDVSGSASVKPTPARPQNAALVEGNAMDHALPLFEALADGVERQVVQGLAPQLNLRLQVTPVANARIVAESLVQRA
jgi:hypothetical protein